MPNDSWTNLAVFTVSPVCNTSWRMPGRLGGRVLLRCPLAEVQAASWIWRLGMCVELHPTIRWRATNDKPGLLRRAHSLLGLEYTLLWPQETIISMPGTSPPLGNPPSSPLPPVPLPTARLVSRTGDLPLTSSPPARM